MKKMSAVATILLSLGKAILPLIFWFSSDHSTGNGRSLQYRKGQFSTHIHNYYMGFSLS